MAGKISEMSDASTLDGSEQLEVVQSGSNKKVTVNDLLPVQLQEDKTIDLDEHFLKIQYDGIDWLSLDAVGGTSLLYAWNTDGATDQASGLDSEADATSSQSNLTAYFDVNGTSKSASIGLIANASGTQIIYQSDIHTFNGLINLPTQSAPASPNDGDIWREDNTNTGLKIRINGTTKTIVVA